MSPTDERLDQPSAITEDTAAQARQRLQGAATAERETAGAPRASNTGEQPVNYNGSEIYRQSSTFAPVSIQSDKLPSGQDAREEIVVENRQRQFELHTPASYDGHSKLPVIYMMPGLGETIDQLRNESAMNRLADEKGFAVVYVQALPVDFPGSMGLTQALSWNMDHGSLTEKAPGYDDINYLRAVEKRVGQEVNVDTQRRYIEGFSEGGGAAQYVAHEMPGVFAGVGSVHGTMLDTDPRPRSDDPTAFIGILGDDDNMLPLHGGHGYFDGGRPVKGIMTMTLGKVSGSEPLAQAPAWAKANGYTAGNQSDSKHNHVADFSGGTAPVEEIIRHSHFHNWGYQGGQHAWDGKGETGKSDYGWWAVGEPDPTQDTGRDTVNFLLQFEKPAPPSQNPLCRTS